MSAGLDPTQPIHPPMGRRAGRFLLVCAGVAVVVVGITLRNAHLERQRDLAAMIAAAESAQYPLDPQALEAAYHAGKPEPNAADIYLEALALLDAGDTDGALERVIEAAAMDRCRFPLRFEQEAAIPFDLAGMRDLSRVLSDALRQAVTAGDAESARAMLEAQFAVAESLNEAPLLIMQAMRGALLQRALDDLAAVFASPLLNGAWLVEIEQRLARIDLQPALVDAVAVERAVTFAATVERGEDRGGLATVYDVAAGSQIGLLRGVLIAYGELLEAAATPVRLRSADLDRLSALPSTLGRYERMPAEMILMPVLRIFVATAQNEGLLAAASGAAVIERYRIAEGALPETAADLTARGMSLPGDPLGTAAIGYRRVQAGYLTWSAGLDGLDDGGVLDSDVVFPVEARR